MIVPFLKEISKRDELLNNYLLFSFIYTFIFPNLIYYLSYKSNILNKFNQLLIQLLFI